MQITPPTVIEAIYEEEIRQRYLEIRDAFNREVVTTIELIFPFSKAKAETNEGWFIFPLQSGLHFSVAMPRTTRLAWDYTLRIV